MSEYDFKKALLPNVEENSLLDEYYRLSMKVDLLIAKIKHRKSNRPPKNERKTTKSE